ncbi:hypothetical protein [Fodinicola feengrottensis]|uniref:hypothetical protein n=1 Tax=Fodinicola feengrottensis TaxID=435914 RepID=UPI0013CFB3EB|nr:hypothetical protein [Fodinicola feengrottensis]
MLVVVLRAAALLVPVALVVVVRRVVVPVRRPVRGRPVRRGPVVRTGGLPGRRTAGRLDALPVPEDADAAGTAIPRPMTTTTRTIQPNPVNVIPTASSA